MTIFKFIFHHDLMQEQLRSVDENTRTDASTLSIEDFMKPLPTYSRFYFSATDIDIENFGFSSTRYHKELEQAIASVFSENQFIVRGKSFSSLSEALSAMVLYEGCIILPKNKPSLTLPFHGKDHIREYGSAIHTAFEMGGNILFKVAASNGYDLQLFSEKNVYPDFFHAFQPLLAPTFRIFSINGKRMSSDRLFFFETYRLSDPPHGFEEIFPDTQI